MSRQTNTWNAYESTLTGPLTSGSTSVSVESALGLVAPCYLVLDPDNPDKREWVRVNTINSNTLENLVRNLAGSIGNIDHDSGAKVRAVFTKQLSDDIFADVDDLETSILSHVQDPGDPHAPAGYLKQGSADGRYLQLNGAIAMTGELSLSTQTPSGNLIAAAKGYVDTQDAAGAAAAASTYLPLAGGTLTGELELSSSSPSGDLIAASKGYVDTQIAAATGGGAAIYLQLDGANNETGNDEWLQRGAANGYYLGLNATAAAAAKWATARTFTITLTGDASGSVNAQVDGTVNNSFTVPVTVANDSHTHGTQYYTKAQIDSLLASLTIPASRVLPGTFPAGVFTFNGGLTVTGTMGVGGGFELPNIAQNAGTHALRYNSSNGVVTYN